MKPTTGPLSVKEYKCSRCGNISKASTNHWGEFYDRCTECSPRHGWADKIVTHVCMEPVPEGYDTPTPWKKVQLGDLVDQPYWEEVIAHRRFTNKD